MVPLINLLHSEKQCRTSLYHISIIWQHISCERLLLISHQTNLCDIVLIISFSATTSDDVLAVKRHLHKRLSKFHIYYFYISSSLMVFILVLWQLWSIHTERHRDRYLYRDRWQVHRTQWESVLLSVSVQCEVLCILQWNPFLSFSASVSVSFSVSLSVKRPLIAQLSVFPSKPRAPW